jgi:hypothetical protein
LGESRIVLEENKVLVARYQYICMCSLPHAARAQKVKIYTTDRRNFGGEGGILNQALELSRHVFSNMRKNPWILEISMISPVGTVSILPHE